MPRAYTEAAVKSSAARPGDRGNVSLRERRFVLGFALTLARQPAPSGRPAVPQHEEGAT
jgi:hypothetical protein